MILLERSFTTRMPLLTATGAFGLGKRRLSFQRCYQHRLGSFYQLIRMLNISCGVVAVTAPDKD